MADKVSHEKVLSSCVFLLWQWNSVSRICRWQWRYWMQWLSRISDMKFLSSLSSYSGSKSNSVSNKFRDDSFKHSLKINCLVNVYEMLFKCFGNLNRLIPSLAKYFPCVTRYFTYLWKLFHQKNFYESFFLWENYFAPWVSQTFEWHLNQLPYHIWAMRKWKR